MANVTMKLTLLQQLIEATDRGLEWTYSLQVYNTMWHDKKLNLEALQDERLRLIIRGESDEPNTPPLLVIEAYETPAIDILFKQLEEVIIKRLPSPHVETRSPSRSHGSEAREAILLQDLIS